MLKFRSSQYDQIRRHGEQAYPLECCGILLGTFAGETRIVQAAVPCANAHPDSPQTRYCIDPAEVARIQRQARERGLEFVGFYHSHPDHPADWSETDLDNAWWPGCSYVITHVANGKAALTNSFVLIGSAEDKKLVAEAILVE